MKFKLNLLDSNDSIYKAITEDIKNKIDSAVSKAIPNISLEIKNRVSVALRDQPEYTSLMTGKLKAEFGIPDSSRVESVIEGLVNSLNVERQKTAIRSRSGIFGGFVLTMMKSDDFDGLINTDIALVNDEKGYSLPWLRWLLLEGSNSIVKNYSVQYGPSTYSRSGLAIMVPSASNWSVPPEFSGTESDNWTTRAINSVEQDVYAIIQNNIEKYL